VNRRIVLWSFLVLLGLVGAAMFVIGAARALQLSSG